MNSSNNPNNSADKSNDQVAADVTKSKSKTSKIPMLNQAWIDETVRSYGLAPGPLATRAGQQLAASLETKLTKATSREKITKLIRTAVATSIGKDLP
jgi:hypothetical protein